MKTKLVSVTEMIAIEQEANTNGISYNDMMRNAGEGLAKLIYKRFNAKENWNAFGLIGSGNNGGDTLVALTWLAKNGWKTTGYVVQTRSTGDPLIQQLKTNGGTVLRMEDDRDLTKMDQYISQSSVIFDGVLGTGIKLPLRSSVAKILKHVGETIRDQQSDIQVVAVDCPSGIDCDSGESAPETLKADITVTMAAVKQGLLKFPAFELVGELKIVEIGLPQGGSTLKAWRNVKRFVPDIVAVKKFIPDRPLSAHKGTFGTATIVAGCLQYPGAALLAGEAAYITGTGLVTLAVPFSIHSSLLGQLTEATWIPLPDEYGVISEDASEVLVKNLSRTTALLIGPGFGLAVPTKLFIKKLLERLNSGKNDAGIEKYSDGQTIPIILDADGLKLVSEIAEWHRRLPPLSILTPHPGEMSVLTGLPINEIQHQRIEIAEYFSNLWGHIVVLKGAHTVISSPEGITAVIPVATPALARAGSGDVLAGLITGFRAQGVNAFEAAVAGAWIHAQAGLGASRAIGNPASVLARDITHQSINVMSKLYEK